MNGLMPYTTTATELQRNYKKVASKAKKLKQPIIVLSNNRPEAVYIDYEFFKQKYKEEKRGLPKDLYAKGRKRSKKKSGFEQLFGSWTKEEADKFDKIIEDAFEKVNPEEWK